MNTESNTATQELVETDVSLQKSTPCNKVIFSKVLAEKEECKVVFLAYGAGYTLEPQSVCTEVICTGLEGRALLTVEGQEILIKEGIVITIPALATHSLQVQTDFKMLMIK